MGLIETIGALVTVCAVLALAWWCTRMLGKRWGGGSVSGELRIIDQVQVGQDKRIVLIRLKDQNYLIGVGQSEITLLAEPEGEFELSNTPVVGTEQVDFKKVIQNCLSHQRRDQGGKR